MGAYWAFLICGLAIALWAIVEAVRQNYAQAVVLVICACAVAFGGPAIFVQNY